MGRRLNSVKFKNGNFKEEDFSPKVREVLKYIREYVKENDNSPTYVEIGKRVNLKSSASVYNHIRFLKSIGVLENVGVRGYKLSMEWK